MEEGHISDEDYANAYSNDYEKIAYDWLKEKGIKVKRICSTGIPDFEGEKEYYEVKNKDYYETSRLSPIQSRIFPRLDKPVNIIYVKAGKVESIEKFLRKKHSVVDGTKILLTFEDEDFEELKKKKGKDTWHDFIIKIAGI